MVLFFNFFRIEAQNCPDVVVAKINPQKLQKQTTVKVVRNNVSALISIYEKGSFLHVEISYIGTLLTLLRINLGYHDLFIANVICEQTSESDLLILLNFVADACFYFVLSAVFLRFPFL